MGSNLLNCNHSRKEKVSSLLNLSGAPIFKVVSGLSLIISVESSSEFSGASTGFFSVSGAVISAGAG